MRVFVALLVMVLTGAGCVPTRIAKPAEPPAFLTEPTRTLGERRETIEPGMVMVRASLATSTPGEMVMVGFDQERFSFRLAATGTRLNMEDWQAAFLESVAGINGVYFLEDFSAAGFFVSADVKQTKRRFDGELSALIAIEETLEIVDTKRKNVDLAPLKQGAQTYPVLIRDGKVAWTRETGKAARRSWVGIDRRGWVWMGVLANDEASLYELAARLDQLDVDWQTVVNLDGGPSTGMFVRTDGFSLRRETFGGVPNVLLVERRR